MLLRGMVKETALEKVSFFSLKAYSEATVVEKHHDKRFSHSAQAIPPFARRALLMKTHAIFQQHQVASRHLGYGRGEDCNETFFFLHSQLL